MPHSDLPTRILASSHCLHQPIHHHSAHIRLRSPRRSGSQPILNKRSTPLVFQRHILQKQAEQFQSRLAGRQIELDVMLHAPRSQQRGIQLLDVLRGSDQIDGSRGRHHAVHFDQQNRQQSIKRSTSSPKRAHFTSLPCCHSLSSAQYSQYYQETKCTAPLPAPS